MVQGVSLTMSSLENKMEIMTRSELARKCGINIESLRYYERRKLIELPSRSDSGYRLYSEEDAVKIQFIKSAQKLGFTLNEISELLKLRIYKNKSCDSVLKKAQMKLGEVERKLKALKSMQKVLKQMIHRCEDSTPTSDCPILCSFESGREI